MNVFIIAEAGVNHNGSIDLAKKLIDGAVDAGVDAVKFQTFKAKNLVTQDALKASYQIDIGKASESQFDMLKKLELDKNAHEILIKYCKKKGIVFLSTPFDHESINLLYDLGMRIFKIPSGEITNLPYLRHIGSLAEKVILSSGMATLKEISNALKILNNSGMMLEDITVLHANTMYPTPMEDVNLKAMHTIQNEFNVNVGYSDHTLGIEVDIAAVAMGASIIEKHFTLDKKMLGPDHMASLNITELRLMVESIRNIERALGNGVKSPTPSEKVNLQVVRKSIVACKNIKKGELLTNQNITVKRPAGGISPMEWDNIVGSKATKDYSIDDFI